MLYEYRHLGRRRRGCPTTFELRRNLSARDHTAPCPKCGSAETERIKFQAFAIAGGANTSETTGVGGPRPVGSGPYDDFDAASFPSDDDD